MSNRKKRVGLLVFTLLIGSLLGYSIAGYSNGGNPIIDELLGAYLPWFNASKGVNAPEFYRNDENYTAWVESQSGMASWNFTGATAYVGFDSTQDYRDNYWYVSGSADDEIQSAIDYVKASGGGTVVLSAGRFNIDNTIAYEISSSYIKLDLVGQGFSTYLNNRQTDGSNCIEVDGTASHYMGGRIAHLAIESDVDAGAAIYLERTFQFRVDNVFIGNQMGTHQYGTYGVEVNNSYTVYIVNSQFYMTGSHAVYVYGYSTDIHFEENEISDCGAEYVYFEEVVASWVNRNYFEGGNGHEHTFIYIGETCSQDWVEDNYFSTGALWGDTPLIDVVGASGAQTRDIKINGNDGTWGAKGGLLRTNEYTYKFIITGNSVWNGTLGFNISGVNHTLAHNIASGMDGQGILFYYAENCLTDSNTCFDNGGTGIDVTFSTNIKLADDVCNENGGSGFSIAYSTDCTINDGTAIGNTLYGAKVYATDNTKIFGGNYNYNTRHGILYDSSDDGSIIGVTASWNDPAMSGNWDGICIEDDSDNTIIQFCMLNYNWRYGISIGVAADSCVGTWVKNNQLLGNIGGAFSDQGMDTKLETISIPFVTGTVYSSTSGEIQGWNITADTNYAATSITLPLTIQQVVRIKIYGASWVADGQGMTLQIEINGATSNEAFNTENVAIATLNSITSNFMANEVIYWTITEIIDEDVGDLLGGDSLQIIIFHEAANGENCATEMAARDIIVEFV